MSSHAAYEQKHHGSNTFPVEHYHVNSLHPRYDMPFHWHMECEFISVIQGSFTISIDGNPIMLKPGMFAFVPAGAIHGGIAEGNDSIYECLVIDLEYFCQALHVEQGSFTSILNHGSNIHHVFSLEDSVGVIIQRMFDESQDPAPGHEFFMAALILGFIGTVIRDKAYTIPSDTEGQNSQQTNQIKRALTRIRHDYRQPLTLEELSSEAMMAPNYFCRLFRRMVGRPPIDYLNYYRVERAAELIYATNEVLTEIALKCGFNDAGYFSRTFRKYKGMSPSEYRRQTHSIAKK